MTGGRSTIGGAEGVGALGGGGGLGLVPQYLAFSLPILSFQLLKADSSDGLPQPGISSTRALLY